MALKGKYARLEDIPEALRDHYTEQGTDWVLDVTDSDSNKKVAEFRQNNIRLMQELEEAKKAALSGEQVTEYAELKSKALKEREKKLIDAGKVEEMFAERLTPIKAEKERVEKELRATVAAQNSRLESLLIDNEIRATAAKNGVRATAIDDVLLRGRQLFKLNGDKVVPMQGDQIVFGKDGEALGMGEWVGSLATTAPHLFESSQGSGAPKLGQNSPGLGGNRVSRSDTKAFIANAAGIANGTVQVVD